MRKNVFGRQLKRDKNERQALFKNLMSSLVLNEKIKTTEEKAKSIRGHVEKLVTKAKNGGTNLVSTLQQDLTPPAAQKVVVDLAIRFEKRPGGYTRMVKLGRRLSDNASMVLMEWVEGPIKVESSKLKVESKTKKTETVKEPEAEKPKRAPRTRKVAAKK